MMPIASASESKGRRGLQKGRNVVALVTEEVTYEEVSVQPSPHTVTEAWKRLWENPAQFLRYWNYKGAILSGVLRAPIFLITYLIGNESLKLALGAALVQFVFRFFFAGVTGALIQTFRRVEPAWKALATVLLMVPLVSHLFEFVIQASFAYLTATEDHTDEAILRSICVSIISALFTMFAMRRNLMIVGEEESKSLMHDISRMPVTIFYFIAFVPNELSGMFRRGALIGGSIGVAAFGLFSQLLVWAITNKRSWTYGGGKEVPLLNYWGVDGMILLVIAMAISAYVYNRSKHHTY